MRLLSDSGIHLVGDVSGPASSPSSVDFHQQLACVHIRVVKTELLVLPGKWLFGLRAAVSSSK